MYGLRKAKRMICDKCGKKINSIDGVCIKCKKNAIFNGYSSMEFGNKTAKKLYDEDFAESLSENKNQGRPSNKLKVVVVAASVVCFALLAVSAIMLIGGNYRENKNDIIAKKEESLSLVALNIEDFDNKEKENLLKDKIDGYKYYEYEQAYFYGKNNEKKIYLYGKDGEKAVTTVGFDKDGKQFWTTCEAENIKISKESFNMEMPKIALEESEKQTDENRSATDDENTADESEKKTAKCEKVLFEKDGEYIVAYKADFDDETSKFYCYVKGEKKVEATLEEIELIQNKEGGAKSIIRFIGEKADKFMKDNHILDKYEENTEKMLLHTEAMVNKNCDLSKGFSAARCVIPLILEDETKMKMQEIIEKAETEEA